MLMCFAVARLAATSCVSSFCSFMVYNSILQQQFQPGGTASRLKQAENTLDWILDVDVLDFRLEILVIHLHRKL